MPLNLRIWVFYLTACTSTACAQVANVPTIDFTSGHNLRVVYEAGLRPWRTNPAERFTLMVDQERLGITLPQAKRFEMEVEHASFRLLDENELGSADFTSQPMTVEQGQELTKEICEALDVSTDGLDEFVARFHELVRNPAQGKRNEPRTWTRFRVKKGDIRYHIVFHPLRGWDRSFSTVTFTAEFYEEGKPMKRLTEPVKQPPGFEHVSMERDKNKPSRGPSWMKPITGADLARGLEVPKAATITPDNAAASPVLPPSTPPPTSAPTLPTKQPANLVWWIVCLTILAAGVVFVTRNKKPKA